MIVLPVAVREEMFVHAVEEYPSECCGYLTGTDDPASWVAYRCRNIQNELHARDPHQYPRDARTAYTFSKEDMERLFFGETSSPDDRVVGFYHSHPDHPAYFSDEDRTHALVDLIRPEPFYLVISVINRVVQGMRAFVWDEQQQQFQELEVQNGGKTGSGQ
ncbi:MAG: M67 family metallopeptidase [Candidatus Latescibacteria bacterium]|nr:M67 family metallopeptidase [Candidatus Latescibacterota bacterium]